MSDTSSQTLRIQGIPPFVDASLRLGRRITAITGDNGVGKTVILDALYFMLTGHWPGGRVVAPGVMETEPVVQVRFGEQVKTSIYNRRARYWLDTERPLTDQVMVISLDAKGGTTIFDPLKHETDFSPSHHLVVPLHLSEQDLWYGAHQYERDFSGTVVSKKTACRGFVEDLATWKAKSSSIYSAFEEILRYLSPPNEEIRISDFQRIDLSDSLYVPILQMSYGSIPATKASAGIKKILGLAYGIIWAIERHLDFAKITAMKKSRTLILLVDEIEGHFHPKWQRVIVKALWFAVRDAWGSDDVQLVFTTHAPLVMAGAEDIADPNLDTQVLVDLEGTPPQAVINASPWTKHGTVADWLDSQQFGEVLQSSDAYANAHAALATLIAQDHASDEEIANLQTQLQAALPDDDPAWQEWSWFLEDRKLQAKAL
ncbi:MAG: ATP-binding protein [Alphaproteobacteria bacterium]|nr:MAG: ATP-binding protein [Alphaproteobacteria bacterium]